VALREQSLPWGHPAVRILVQQTMFHLGDISTESGPENICSTAQLLWKTDLFTNDGWSVMQHELEELAAHLKFKQREDRSLVTVGSIAAYASQWNEQSRETARSFADITRKWADDLGDEQPAVEDIADQRARRCLWYMYSIVCHGMGNLNAGDVDQLCQLVLLANYTRLFEEETQHDEEVRRLAVIVHAVMARRLPELLEALDTNQQPLTSAVQLILQQAPEDLEWTRVCFDTQETGCFEAFEAFEAFDDISRLSMTFRPVWCWLMGCRPVDCHRRLLASRCTSEPLASTISRLLHVLSAVHCKPCDQLMGGFTSSGKAQTAL